MAEKIGQKVENLERVLTLMALASFGRERENLLAAVEWAYEAGQWEIVMGLFESLTNFFDICSLWADWERVGEKAVEAAEEGGDKWQLGAALDRLATVYRLQAKWSEAAEIYKRALVIAQELGERGRQGEGATLGNLGNVYAQQSRWSEAIGCYVEALGIFRELGDRHGEGKTLVGLGNVYAQQGRWDEAIGCYEDSLAIFRELGDRHGEGGALTNLGLVYADLGRWKEAIEKYEQALAIFRELGDRHGEGQTLMGLGEVYAGQDELDKALETAGHALCIFEELRAYADLVTCHRLMASLSLRAGNSSACFNHLAQALSLALQIHPKPVVETLGDIVDTAKGLGGEGRWEEVAALGGGLHGMVVEMEKEEPRSEELKAVGMLARRVCAVIALAGKGHLEEVSEGERAEARETALEMAKAVDEVTGGRWGLEEWVGERTAD